MTLLLNDAPAKDPHPVKLRTTALVALTLLAGCRHPGDVTADNGGGIYAVRSTCPIVGVPTGTGDITLFNPQGSTDSAAIDVSAAITKVRAYCQDAGNDVISGVFAGVGSLLRRRDRPRPVPRAARLGQSACTSPASRCST